LKSLHTTQLVDTTEDVAAYIKASAAHQLLQEFQPRHNTSSSLRALPFLQKRSGLARETKRSYNNKKINT
jgi:hypothetical protein